MGANLKKCLCHGVYLVNGIPILRTKPTKCLSRKAQTVSFELDGDVLNITNDYDELTNSQSIISEQNLNIKMLKGTKGIKTRLEKISMTIADILMRLDNHRVDKIVFAQPRANDDNKAFIFQAIFGGLYNFTLRFKVNFLSCIYVNWESLPKAEMIEIIERVLKKWKVIETSE